MRLVLAFLAIVFSSQYAFASQSSDYFLVILVAARHLDYRDGLHLFRTMAKHPSDGSKNGDVGHAWVYLQGKQEGIPVFIEGGHSGELGCCQPKYFEGVMNYFEYGYVNPTREQMCNPRHEPNPVKYLWTSPQDGFFQEGCGRHVPTYAIRVDLTPQQFDQILNFMDPDYYDYVDYSITENQCSSYVAAIAALAGLYLKDKVTMSIEPSVKIGDIEVLLWTDPCYSTITFSSPDALEASMKEAVRLGDAEDVTGWYKRHHGRPLADFLKDWKDSICQLPERWYRAYIFR